MADKALLLGINEYESISDLRGCLNDTDNVERLLTELYGFDEVNVKHLRNDEVTKSNVLDELRWLVDEARPGDRIVFHFSGHGSHIRSQNEDEDEDELICLYDMHWSNADSYLLDDDLGRLTGMVPQGVRLTVILDSCHSGTGTRALGQRQTVKTPRVIMADTMFRLANKQCEVTLQRLDEGDSELLDTLQSQPPQAVLARFVEAPQKYRSRRRSPHARQFGACLKRDVLNHQLLAGARADQTAADAFIDDDFHGAFTYHLAASARDFGPGAATRQVMDHAREQLREKHYSQVPQLEGIGVEEPLFGPREGGSVPDIRPPQPVPTPPATVQAAGVSGQAPTGGTELLSQMLRVAEKFLDFANRMSGAEPGQKAPTDTGRDANETVVYVHGISQHRQGFSSSWWNAMRPHLSRSMARREVVWSDVVNPRGVASAARAVSSDAERAREQIEFVLDDRMRQATAQAPPGELRSVSDTRSAVRGSGLSIDDFVRYMFNADEREQILSRFDAVVRPLLQAGTTVQIIAHSWGTVVAWEGLRRLDAAGLSGRVANLFLVGSALSIGPVRSNLFDRIDGGRLPSKVARAINLDAGGDIVGGPVRGAFSVQHEFLDLDPVGCSTIPFTNTAWNPGCAHSSYFVSANDAVNRGIFAKFIN